MSNTPDDLKYTATHEWVSVSHDGIATVGITEHAQELLGDIVFVELPEEGSEVSVSEEAGVVESVKAASDVYAPVSGTVVGINSQLVEAPETVNADAFGDGWFFRIKISDTKELDALLSAEDYAAQCEEE